MGNDVSIYYPGFHKFASDCESTTVDGSDCKFAHNLCLVMKLTYLSENDRVHAFVSHLNLYMRVKLKFGTKGPYADFYLDGVVFGEGKNEPGSTNCASLTP